MGSVNVSSVVGAMVVVKERLPWWLKVGAKIILSRLRLPCRLWHSWGIFQHGAMLNPEYALRVFRKHYAQVQAYLPPNYTVLEFGPGDSLATAVIATVYGAKKVWLVDAGSFASLEIEAYQHLCQQLEEFWHGINYSTISEMLAATNAAYLTEGLQSLRTIPDNSVDLVFSQAVLEHVPLNEFAQTLCELYRLQKPGGISSHRIDLQDHLEHSLHSLRFSHTVWESKFFAKSGFYTNRLRASQIVEAFRVVGYQLLSRQEDSWPSLPLRRHQLHPAYASFSDDDLLIRGLALIAQKPW
jgi:SAM-dependent methyltransferase